MDRVQRAGEKAAAHIEESFDERNRRFRREYLAPFGGWLADLVITVSHLTGIWDFLLLATVFIVAWVILRTANMETAMILGYAFDLSIPLQYYCDDELSAAYSSRLEEYWPIMIVASLAEVGCYFVLHPDLFTLLVCLKSTAMLVVWIKGTANMATPADVSARPAGSSSRTADVHRDTTGSNVSSDASGKQGRPRDSIEARFPPFKWSKPNHTTFDGPDFKHVKDADKRLRTAGYTDPWVREGRIRLLNADPKNARANLKAWEHPNRDMRKIEEKNKRYASDARKAVEAEKAKAYKDAGKKAPSGPAVAGERQSNKVEGAAGGYGKDASGKTIFLVPKETLALLEQRLTQLKSEMLEARRKTYEEEQQEIVSRPVYRRPDQQLFLERALQSCEANWRGDEAKVAQYVEDRRGDMAHLISQTHVETLGSAIGLDLQPRVFRIPKDLQQAIVAGLDSLSPSNAQSYTQRAAIKHQIQATLTSDTMNLIFTLLKRDLANLKLPDIVAEDGQVWVGMKAIDRLSETSGKCDRNIIEEWVQDKQARGRFKTAEDVEVQWGEVRKNLVVPADSAGATPGSQQAVKVDQKQLAKLKQMYLSRRQFTRCWTPEQYGLD